ncbi:amino acid transporter [Exophiala xenobiotica]|nr:amino acid transporter [Exophiala xenobiotica]KAK5289184.1 amino acid transporter [Exophiala xenobiotica]KAK5500078.1 amino acid transporter [Exophiala xenobiotica]
MGASMDAPSRGEDFEVLPNKEALSPSKSDMIVKNGEISIDKTTALHRGLKSRHTTMIALGGALGSGLIIGTGSALASSGPASVLISYTVVGIVVWLMLTGLCEMGTYLPIAEGFTGYASRFVDPAMGFALGYSYWLKYAISTPNQLTAIALVLQYWVPREKVNPGVFIAVFLVVIILVNYIGVRFFGEFEFWLSSIKVLVLVGVILLSLILACGGGPDHDPKGFRYWHNPGAFKEYKAEGSLGRFLGVWYCMGIASFAYLSTEFIGVTVGEAQNPRRTIPRAARLIFYRIFFFYVISVFFLGMLVPYNSPKLAFATKQSTSAAASPFVVAIVLAGIKVLPGILNACIMIFVFSAGISDLYISSRTLYGLAADGKAPRFLAKTNSRGVPVAAMGTSAAFALLAFMNVSSDSKKIFGYFINCITVFGLIVWVCILLSHIQFVRARKAQQISEEHLRYKAPCGVYGSWAALVFCVLVVFTKNFSVFIHTKTSDFDYKNFITGYIAIPVFLVMFFGYKVVYRTKGVRPAEADLHTGLDEIELHEMEFAKFEAERLVKQNRLGRFYRRYISWLF